MKLEFLFIAGRREEKYNVFGAYPYVYCNTCHHGVEYPNTYTYGCGHFFLADFIYPSCYKSRTSNTILWRKL